MKIFPATSYLESPKRPEAKIATLYEIPGANKPRRPPWGNAQRINLTASVFVGFAFHLSHTAALPQACIPLPGLVPGTHVFELAKEDVDGRVKPGHGDLELLPINVSASS